MDPLEFAKLMVEARKAEIEEASHHINEEYNKKFNSIICSHKF